MFFSIVIINYGYPEINRVIDRAKRVKNSELIVIESGYQVLDEIHKREIKYKFFTERLMPGGARNEGAKIAKGQYILFLDSDVILTEQPWTTKMEVNLTLINILCFGCSREM